MRSTTGVRPVRGSSGSRSTPPSRWPRSRRSTRCTSAWVAPRCSARCSGASPTAHDDPPGVSGPEIHTAPVVVLGGGIAGLTATRERLRTGIDAVLYEAGPKVGGMADSHFDTDGFTFD